MHKHQVTYPMQEVGLIIDEQHNAICWSVLDLKPGFWNILVKLECRRCLGLVTSDGLFWFKWISQGLTNALQWFQYVINTVLLYFGVQSACGFVDKITVTGQVENWHHLWQDTMAVLLELSKTGFMINLQNCCFC